MKIVYVYPAIATKGGVERILVEKMNLLAREKGCEVTLLTYDQGEHEVAFALDERVRHIDLQVKTYVKYRYGGWRRLWEEWRRRSWLRQRLWQQLRVLKPDICVTPTNGEVVLLNRLCKDIALVVESHGGFDHLIDFGQDTWWHRLDVRRRRRAIRRADAVVCLTKRDGDRWTREGYGNVHVIPNIAHLNPTGVLSSGKEKRALFVGRFARQKGIEDLLAIWQKVCERHPDWTLEMFGENYEQYQDCVGEGIVVHAPTSDVFSQYCKSSMLLLSSRWEPFGLVIPEAMSCAVPVVSFEGDGPCEIISDGEDGYIVKDRNKDEFAARVCQLIADEELRRQMGRNAVRSARRYSSENILPLWQELFESLAG